MKIYIFLIFASLLIILSCKTTVIKEKPKETQQEKKSTYGFIDDNTFIINAIGYPKVGSSDKSMNSAYEAALSLAKVKTETAFIDESTDVVDKNKIKYIVEKYGEAVSSKTVDERYVEIIFKVEIKDLRKLLKNGDLDFLTPNYK